MDYKLSEEEKDRMIAFAGQTGEGDRMKDLLSRGYPNFTDAIISSAPCGVNDFTSEAGGEVKDSEYEGITSKVKDQQRLYIQQLANVAFASPSSGALGGLDPRRAAHGLKIKNNQRFNDWFDSYSFAYVPIFAKPLIKQWVKAAYLAALGEVK